ncbi:alpha/beta fold hydrolase [Caulobacter sp. FWC2]|uniref:alpha/beta fold hydrolase n=1 Tax=Caulobacter sp. FWC2 TaxID=69664 RepID=UPI000C146643|nr:alpha/beta hydrolase [Caulobacter sp. FWC2]PIB92576.1 hypothetical protein CSW62_13950 [Caulobacter sp. FWC2]
MDIIIGALGGLALCAFATLVGFDRDRAFYPVMLAVIAGYYLLFAIMSGDTSALVLDGLVMISFLAVAVIGFKTNLWVVAAALLAHGVFDAFHRHLIDNPGAPPWWPTFCLTFDVAAAAYLSFRIRKSAPSRRILGAGGLVGALLLAAVAGAAFGGDSQALARGGLKIAKIDGRQIAYRVTGEGRPVVVLISGVGEGMSSFATVEPELARQATVISYDRAGYGMSDAPVGPRDAAAIDRELTGLLKATGIPGPYVLAGHSSGGLYAQYFAAHHPQLVAGLIFIDARPAEFTEACRRAGIEACIATPAMVRFSPKGAQAEVAALHNEETSVKALNFSRTPPTLVLSRAQVPTTDAFARTWSATQASLAGLYSGSVHLTAPKGGHDIHRSAKIWFVASVSAFLRTLR